jgi:hypothetical protein
MPRDTGPTVDIDDCGPAASVPFLVKPFLPEHLLDIVTRALARGTR